MSRASILVLVAASAACGRADWPDPPPIDPAQYQQEYASWRADRQQTISSSLPIVGIWRLPEGDTPFGGDPSLPVALPAAQAPARAGVFRRSGFDVTVVPASGVTLRAGGTPIGGPAPVTFEQGVSIGTLDLSLAAAPDGRLWITGSDSTHPAVTNPPPAQAYPLDSRWRVAARFDGFEKPRPVKVADVRGGDMEFDAVGQLVFRVDGEERRLTAFGTPDADTFFVMFKDATNESTTYRGYRIVSAGKVPAGEWTVVDFNLAFNPPCAFSPYTVCPLPPPENRLDVAVEAGEQRLPSAQGFTPAS